ncbi:pksN [Symbiodinium microadriaticum]|nr:pksN [Symbiodinium microadriaticum]CAE7310246.1 pksN [Symbiodinium sp. KB8]
MPAHLTKVSNSDLRAQYDLPDPIAVLEQRLDQKIQQPQQNQGDPAIKRPGVLEYWNQLLTRLKQAANTPASTVLMEAPASTQYACPTCGMYYPTKKALRQHRALRHGQIQADKLDIEYKPEQRSVAGMPQRKHCTATSGFRDADHQAAIHMAYASASDASQHRRDIQATYQGQSSRARKKCLPLLQLSLRLDGTASTIGAGATAGTGLGSQLPACGDANPAAPRERSPITDEPRTAEQVQEGAGQRQADSEQEGKRARRRGGRRRDVDGSRSARRGDSQTHFESVLIKTATRHEQQLTSLESDRSFVFFMEKGNHGLIGMMIQASQAWRHAQALQTAEAAHWITRSPLQWAYTEWNAEQKKALPSSRDNLPHEEAKRAVNNLLKITAKDDIVHRFQSLKPLKPELQAEVVVMLLTLTLRQKGEEIQKDLDLLADNSVGKVVGLRLRRERVSKTALAKELEKLRL